MATTSVSPELASMAQFREALPASARASDTADRLCAVGRFNRFSRGQELVADLHDDRLVFISHGQAKLVARSLSTRAIKNASGRPDETANAENTHILAFHFPGDIVSVLRQSDGDFRLVALNDLELILFGANQFLDVAQGDPAVIRAVLARSLHALHRSRTKVMQLGHKSAGQRIADFLVSMAERVAGCTSGACEFALPMSRRDIGDSLGLTIETVSRQFAELREAGLIETEGRSLVRLKDIDALGALSTSAPNTRKTSQT